MRWIKWLRRFCPVPLPATCLDYRIVRKFKKMKTAKIEVDWKPSVSPDIIGQRIEITRLVGDKYIPYLNVELPIGVSTFVFTADELEVLNVVVYSSDGTFITPSENLQINVPDFSAPAPATFLDWRVVEVFDKLPEY